MLEIITNIKSFKLKNLSEFFQSEDFAKAISMAIALTVPVVLGIYFDALEVGINITLGAILTSPPDTVGNIRLKVRGLLMAVVLSVVVTLISSFLKVNLWVFLPVLGILVFAISYLSIYGFRASLVSFSGLFALVLSFSSLSESDLSVGVRVLLIGLGGVWYVLLVLLRHLIFPQNPTEHELIKCINLTANYLKTRAQLIDSSQDRTELSKELIDYQVDIMKSHETLRELLMTTRRNSGKSLYQAKRLLVFTELVDMMELAMSNPVNYNHTDEYFSKNPEDLKVFQGLLNAMSCHLELIAEHIHRPKKLQPPKELRYYLNKIENIIAHYEEENSSIAWEDILMLKNYFKYQKEEVRKIEKIEWLFKNNNTQKIRSVRDKDFKGFLTKENYNPQILLENLNLNSPIFRHSLRISVVSVIGYALGMLLNLQNSYWILLTIIVIMRPNYGFTQTRFRQRTIGTLIGGGLAFLIVLLTQNTTLFAILAIVSFVIGFSMVQRNYKAAATFITMEVLFLYGLLNPDVISVIRFRIMDTLIGAGLSVAGNYLLWPLWEIKSIDKSLEDIIKASKKYLNKIAEFYNQKGEVSTEYKLARKEAFLAIANLSSAFQRMAQEPKSQQKNLDKIYGLVMLNNTFISAVASLGTYIVHNPTTPATEKFNKVVEEIESNLSIALEIIKKKSMALPTEFFTRDILKDTYGYEAKRLKIQPLEGDISVSSQWEEAHLILGQLDWLLDMSKKLVKRLKEIDLK